MAVADDDYDAARLVGLALDQGARRAGFVDRVIERLGGEAARYVMVLFIAVAIFTPVRLAMALSSRSGRAQAPEH